LAMTAAVGTKDVVYSRGDTGLFGTIYEAWANHLNVRTCPEDWWLPVITIVATLVDRYATEQPVRDLFVGGRQEKEEIVVDCPSFSIYDTDYTFLFNEFSKAINVRIKVPGYVSAVACDFSTTTPDQLVASQITVMKSFQKYFDYTMRMCGCGIKGLEMSGTEEDWKNLKQKLIQLRMLLAPIESTLNLSSYFEAVEAVFENLHKTFLEDSLLVKWWSTVLIESKEVEYGPSGMNMRQVDAYNGWLVYFCTGLKRNLKAKELANGECKELSGLSSCPMKIIDQLREVEDNSTLIAGILGFKVHSNTINGVSSLQPAHGWCMMLPPTSPLRLKH